MVTSLSQCSTAVPACPLPRCCLLLQKCATTSLFHHLKDHPSVLTPSEKVRAAFCHDSHVFQHDLPPSFLLDSTHTVCPPLALPLPPQPLGFCCACLLPQEPEFFSYDCNYDPLGCPADKQKEYIEQVGWTR